MSTQVVQSSNEQLVEQYRKDGYAVARGLFIADEIEVIKETFMAAAKDGPVPGLSELVHHKGGEYSQNDPLRFYPRMLHPHRHPDLPVGRVAMRYMLDRRLQTRLRDLLGEEPWAAQSMFYFKPPGARGQDLHQDNFYLRVRPGNCIAAWIAIDRADAENGGMMCVPKTSELDLICPEASDPAKFFTSHHVEPPPGLKPEVVVMEPGDVLFFNGNVIHGSFPNTSKDRFRRSLICHYLPSSSVEINQSYEVLDFNAVRREVAPATGGGPCGTPHEISDPH